MYNQPSDAVHWYMSEFSSRVVAQTGKPEDRYHLGKLILQGLRDAPDFILQIDGGTGESETCQSVLQRSVRCANAFRNIGLKTHDVIVLMGTNHIHLSIPMYGAFFMGIGLACIDMTLTIQELKDTFTYIVPKMVFCQVERAIDVRQALDEICLKSTIVTFGEGNEFCSFTEFLERNGDGGPIESFTACDLDPAETIGLLISTSGTTGLPKSAAVTHKNLAVTIPHLWIAYDKFPEPTKKMLTLSPLQWFSALYKFLFSPIVRVTRVQSSSPITMDHAYFLINKYKPTLMTTSPNMVTALLKPGAKEKCDFSCFEMILCGGSAFHKNLPQDLKAVSPNTQIYNGYGCSELTGIVFNFTYQQPGSCGRGSGLCKYRIVNPETMEDITEPNIPGELWVKGPGVFKGYYGNDEQTAKVLTKDGWVRTGDLLKRDENWNFYFIERLKMLLKYNNHQISPTEIEEVIIKHPGVYQVAVTSMPDKQAGDLPVACVVPQDGYPLTAQEIKDMVKDALTDTKQLRGGVVFLKNLPMTSTSKLNRTKLALLNINTPFRKSFGMYNVQSSDAVHWYMSELGSRVAARTGRPEDRHHLGQLILQGLKDAPDFILQIDGGTGESETCQSVLQRSVRCANAFRNIGLKTHDVIVLMATNHINLCIPMYGAFYTGLGLACIDMTLTIQEMQDMFSCIIPKMVFCQIERALDVQQALDEKCLKSTIVTFGEGNGFCSFTEFLERNGDGEPSECFTATDLDPAETIALLISTSGTTGLPKSAVVTHKNLAVSVPYMWITYDTFPASAQRALILSPIQWFSALYKYIFSPIGRVTRIQSSLPITMDHAYFLINKYKPTVMTTSPNMLTALLKPGAREKCDFSCFETIICGGSAPHKTLIQDFKKASPNTQVYIAYGCSELTGVVFNYACQQPGSCGRSSGHCKYRLVNPETMEDITEPNVPGELWVKGSGIFKGYYRNDEQTAKALTKDGWMRTGDLLKRDENWNFYFVERLKMLLKYNNHQISPTEVEEVIMKHPGVFEVAVTSVPDKQAGDLVVACVVPHDGYQLTAQEIKDMVKETLTDSKQLRGGVVFLKSLPLTSTSKVDRTKLALLVRQMQRA